MKKIIVSILMLLFVGPAYSLDKEDAVNLFIKMLDELEDSCFVKRGTCTFYMKTTKKEHMWQFGSGPITEYVKKRYPVAGYSYVKRYYKHQGASFVHRYVLQGGTTLMINPYSTRNRKNSFEHVKLGFYNGLRDLDLIKAEVPEYYSAVETGMVNSAIRFGKSQERAQAKINNMALYKSGILVDNYNGNANIPANRLDSSGNIIPYYKVKYKKKGYNDNRSDEWNRRQNDPNYKAPPKETSSSGGSGQEIDYFKLIQQSKVNTLRNYNNNVRGARGSGRSGTRGNSRGSGLKLKKSSGNSYLAKKQCTYSKGSGRTLRKGTYQCDDAAAKQNVVNWVHKKYAEDERKRAQERENIRRSKEVPASCRLNACQRHCSMVDRSHCKNISM